MSAQRTEATARPAGAFTTLDGEPYYRIAGFDRMPPFLMSIPSDTDLWMFLSSAGGLTAGRVDPDGSLFPYDTVDRLHDAHHHTGPLTLLRVRRGAGPAVLWQPFAEPAGENGRLERNLYKNALGNRVVFEEIHHGLEARVPLPLVGLRRVRLGAHRGRVQPGRDAGRRRRARRAAQRAAARRAARPVPAVEFPRRRLQAHRSRPAVGTRDLLAHLAHHRPAGGGRAPAGQRRLVSGACRQPRIALSPDAVAAFRRGDPPRDESLLTGLRGNYPRALVVRARGRGAPALAPRRRRRPRPRASWPPCAPASPRTTISTGRSRPASSRRARTCGASSPAPTGCSRRRFPSRPRTTWRTCSSTPCAAASSLTATTCPSPTSRRSFARATGPRPRGTRRGCAALPATVTIRALAARGAASGDADLERAEPRVPAALLRPPARRSEPAVEPLPHPGPRRDGRAGAALRGQLARHLPELGGARRELPRVPAGHDRQVRQRLDGRRLQPLPHHPRRHRLGGARSAPPVERHRLLGRPPGRLPARGCSRRWSATRPERSRRCSIARSSATPTCPTASRRTTRSSPTRATTITFDTDVAARVDARVAATGHRRQAASRTPTARVRHVNLLEKLARPGAVQALEPGARRRHLDEHAAAGVERRQQRARRRRPVDGHRSTTCAATSAFLERLLAQRERCVLPGLAARSWPGSGRSTASSPRTAALLAAPALDDGDRRRVLDALGRAFEAYRTTVDARGVSGTPTPLPVGDVLALCRRARSGSTTRSAPTAAPTGSTTPTTCCRCTTAAAARAPRRPCRAST